jgi:hypothetical protein
LAGFFALTSAHAAITVLGTGSAVTNANSSPGEFTLSDQGPGTRDGIYSYAFNAGATSDMLVVALSGEWSGGAFSVSYGGVPMTIAAQSSLGSGASVYYLANPSATGSVAIDLTSKGTVNGLAIGIASLSNSGNPIYFNGGAADSGTNTISITTNFADSFVMFAGDANTTAGGNPVPDAPLTSLRASWPDDIGSNMAVTGFENGVAAGNNSYSYTSNANSPSPRGIAVAAFSAVPEPSSALLLGLAGLPLILRRKRA